MKEEHEALKILKRLGADLDVSAFTQSYSENEQPGLIESDGVIFIPLPDFFKAPDRKAELRVKNNAPVTNPVIRITEVAVSWNYVDQRGTPVRVGTSRVSPDTPPGGIASAPADQNGCVRNLTFQVTVGIKELNEYIKLDPVSIPDVFGCILTINAGVGTGG